jgi:hypothetical protein
VVNLIPPHLQFLRKDVDNENTSGSTITCYRCWDRSIVGLDAVMRGVTEMERNMGGARQAVEDDRLPERDE